MTKVVYFLSPMGKEIGRENACRKKPLKRCRTLTEVVKKCKSKSLVESLSKTRDINSFCVSNKRGKKTLPISPLLSDEEKQKVRKGKSWLMIFPSDDSDTETDELLPESQSSSSSSSLSSDSGSEDDEFIFV